MRNRLIELLLQSEPIKVRDFDDDWLDGEIEDIADYLIANGVIVPPCKLGDTVYEVSLNTKEVKKAKVCGFEISTGNEVSLVYYLDGNMRITSESLFKKANFTGKKLCLNEKEAEQALSKLQASYEQVKGGAEQ